MYMYKTAKHSQFHSEAMLHRFFLFLVVFSSPRGSSALCSILNAVAELNTFDDLYPLKYNVYTLNGNGR